MNDANEECICTSCSADTTLVSSASVGPHTSSVIYSSEPCMDFQWGDTDDETFFELIKDAFEVMVHWRRNSFLVHSGKAGKDFVLGCIKLMLTTPITLTACCLFQVLLLQKPHAQSKSRDHVHYLEHHLDLWHNGDITALVKAISVFRTTYILQFKKGRSLIMLLESLISLCHQVRLLLPSNFFPWMPRVFYHFISKYPLDWIAMVILHGSQ